MVDSELIEEFTMDDIPHDILRDIYRYWLNIATRHVAVT